MADQTELKWHHSVNDLRDLPKPGHDFFAPDQGFPVGEGICPDRICKAQRIHGDSKGKPRGVLKTMEEGCARKRDSHGRSCAAVKRSVRAVRSNALLV